MKVLHFYRTYWPDTFGGVERTIAAIAEATRPLGAETTVLSLSRTPDQTSGTFGTHQAPKARLSLDIASTGFSADVFSKFAKAAREADLVHYHYPWPFMDLVHFAVRHGKPTLVTYHSDIIRQKTLKRFYAPVMWRFLAGVDRIVATSPRYAETSSVLQRYAKKTSIVPIGLADDYAEPDRDRLSRWRTRLDKPFFLFVGVLRYYKGLDVLVRAAKRTQSDIVIVGDGPMEHSLKRQVETLGARNVHFLGPVDDADKLALHALSLGFVFPSNQRSEAFGLSLLEASMMGKPMVSSEIGTGTSFINLDRKTGLVVPPDDSQALAAAMNEIAGNRDRAAEWGRAARTRFLERFTAQRMGEAYFDLYQTLLR